MSLLLEMEYSVTQQSHQGGRDYNEDRTAIFEKDDAIFLVLGDGLGGHAGGEVASQALIDALGDSFNKATPAQLDDPVTFLTLAINFAHHTVHRRAINSGFRVDSPKTTCVACLIRDGVAIWGHSGDSRLYIINQRDIGFTTKDHVSIKPGREHNSPINRCVGGSEPPKPEISEPYELSEGDVVFIASDGAWANFTPDDLIEYVDPEHPSLGLDNLLQVLEGRNKAPSDNLSVVLLYWGVKQLDSRHVDDLDAISPIKLVSESSKDGKDKDAVEVPKFDMKDLDSAILEIETFISDLDSKL